MPRAFDRCQLENHRAFQKVFTAGNPKMFGFHQKLRGRPQNSVDLEMMAVASS